DDARNGDFHPPVISNIPVGSKAGRLHLVHGADHDERDGVPLAMLVLHYADGQMRTVRLAYGVHVRSWLKERRETRSELFDPNSSLAWTTASAEADHAGASLRLFHTVLDNPLPDQKIASLDLVSLFSQATPFPAGLTVGGRPGDSPDPRPG